MSQPRPTAMPPEPRGASISVVRMAIVVVLVVAGIAWVTYYLASAQDSGKPAWMADLGDWNFVIGFGAIFLGLVLSAHPRSPLGRGRGVVVGMLGCFLIGLIWIVVYYVTGQDLRPAGDQRARQLQPARRASASWPPGSSSPPAGSEPSSPQLWTHLGTMTPV